MRRPSIVRGYAAGEMPTVTRPPAENLIRQARVAEALTLAWMVVELLVALWAGIATRSVALTTFGVDSGIELFTAAVVLRLFVLHTERATAEELDARERQASRLVGWSLYGLIAYIVATSAWSVESGSRPESSRVGIALAIAALVIMPLLWRWRLSLARRLESPALRADAACSLVCIYMSAMLLLGLLLNSLLGWWWADPLAALAMVWWIRAEAREALEAARTGMRGDDD
jgi:divalent metal cation (Fe/Co/Zn/Cd) transporter